MSSATKKYLENLLEKGYEDENYEDYEHVDHDLIRSVIVLVELLEDYSDLGIYCYPKTDGSLTVEFYMDQYYGEAKISVDCRKPWFGRAMIRIEGKNPVFRKCSWDSNSILEGNFLLSRDDFND